MPWNHLFYLFTVLISLHSWLILPLEGFRYQYSVDYRYSGHVAERLNNSPPPQNIRILSIFWIHALAVTFQMIASGPGDKMDRASGPHLIAVYGECTPEPEAGFSTLTSQLLTGPRERKERKKERKKKKAVC